MQKDEKVERAIRALNRADAMVRELERTPHAKNQRGRIARLVKAKNAVAANTVKRINADQAAWEASQLKRTPTTDTVERLRREIVAARLMHGDAVLAEEIHHFHYRASALGIAGLPNLSDARAAMTALEFCLNKHLATTDTIPKDVWLSHAAAFAMLHLTDKTSREQSKVMASMRDKAGDKLRCEKRGNVWFYHPGDWTTFARLKPLERSSNGVEDETSEEETDKTLEKFYADAKKRREARNHR